MSNWESQNEKGGNWQPPGDFQPEKGTRGDVIGDSAPSRTGGSRWQRFCRAFTGRCCLTPRALPEIPAPHETIYVDPGITSHDQPSMWRRGHRTPTPLPLPLDASSHYHQYILQTLHFPPAYQSDDAWKGSPWFAEMKLGFGNPDVLAQYLPWRENLQHCYDDTICVRNDPLQPKRLICVRTIHMAHTSDPRGCADWVATISLFHQDSRWLADLPRAEIGAFINQESAVRAFGTLGPTEDILEFSKMFYIKFFKPWHFGYKKKKTIETTAVTDSSRDALDTILDVDEPRLREIVDKNIQRQIQQPGDASSRFMDVDQLAAWLKEKDGK